MTVGLRRPAHFDQRGLVGDRLRGADGGQRPGAARDRLDERPGVRLVGSGQQGAADPAVDDLSLPQLDGYVGAYVGDREVVRVKSLRYAIGSGGPLEVGDY